ACARGNGCAGCAPRARHSSFFFSSRRRHTRWPRDWSSDVCSSDLPDRPLLVALGSSRTLLGFDAEYVSRNGELPLAYNFGELGRSEERRVGKECRCRALSWKYKKKVHMTK